MSVIEPGKEQRGEEGESSPISTRDSLREVSSLGRHTRKLGSVGRDNRLHCGANHLVEPRAVGGGGPLPTRG